jgi:hypothetical protein
MNFARLSIVVLSVCGLASLASGQTLEEKLGISVDAFDSESRSIPSRLIEVAQRFEIPMGIEWSDDPQAKELAPVHIRDTTIGNLLRQILAQQPGYEFRVDDGVVHIFATRLVDDPRNFLNIRLREFSLKKANMAAARYYLWGTIISHLHPRGGYGGGWGGQSMYKDFDIEKITFSCWDLTVRQALSKIVEVQGNALWFVRIRPSQMMEREPFYVQIPGTEGAEPATSFDWQFIALDVNRAG